MDDIRSVTISITFRHLFWKTWTVKLPLCLLYVPFIYCIYDTISHHSWFLSFNSFSQNFTHIQLSHPNYQFCPTLPFRQRNSLLRSVHQRPLHVRFDSFLKSTIPELRPRIVYPTSSSFLRSPRRSLSWSPAHLLQSHVCRSVYRYRNNLETGNGTDFSSRFQYCIERKIVLEGPMTQLFSDFHLSIRQR